MVMTFNDGTLGWQTEGDNENTFAPIAHGETYGDSQGMCYSGGTTGMREDIIRSHQFSTADHAVDLSAGNLHSGRRKDRIKVDSLFMISFLEHFL